MQGGYVRLYHSRGKSCPFECTISPKLGHGEGQGDPFGKGKRGSYSRETERSRRRNGRELREIRERKKKGHGVKMGDGRGPADRATLTNEEKRWRK